MHFIRKLASSLPFQLITMILVVFLAGDYIPLPLKEVALTTSALIKDLLVLVLPYVIFAYLFSTLLALQNGAFLFVVSLLISVVTINFLGLNIAYFASQFLTQASGLTSVSTSSAVALNELWTLPVPQIVSDYMKNEYGLLLGIAFGIGASFQKRLKDLWSSSAILASLIVVAASLLPLLLVFIIDQCGAQLNINITPTLFIIAIAFIMIYFSEDEIQTCGHKLKAGAGFILNKLFIPVVPLFILGFIIQMQHEGTLSYVLEQYGPIYLMIAAVQITYILALFGIGARLNPAEWLRYLRNMLPPMITGISTMSSAAALPFSLTAAEANTRNPLIARSVIPSTVNINLMGDAIGVPLMIIATMITFGAGIPSYELFLMFAIQYVAYMFTVAAVPGATMIVMIPLVEKVLGFNDEMVSLATALYILYDAIGTTVNVMGNGAFVILYNRLFGRLFAK